VGERLSLADISLASVLYLVYRYSGQNFKAELPHLCRW
jgi:glutathione S-transferase